MRRRSVLALPLLAAWPVGATDVPAVAAAASLRFALDEAAAAFTRQTGQQVRLSYGASGSLVQQIEAGAPFQLFLSADEAHVFRLAASGRAPTRGTAYAVGRLAFVTSAASPIRPDPGLAGLGQALKAGTVRKLAIANPETAPYGTRAREALQSAGLWTLARPHLVFGDNVGQALQFVQTGGADAGFVSLSLALAPAFKGLHSLVPAQWHKPLTQRMVLLNGSGREARAFHDWLLSPPGQALLARHGYTTPGGG
jgi:molybdate transport system substrate-binding protein